MEAERISNKKGRRFKNKKRRTTKKKITNILLLVIIMIGIVSISYFLKDYINPEEKEIVEEKVEITSQKLQEEKVYKEMKVKDISLKVDESASYFKCKLENATDKKIEKEDIFIVFIKEDNSELARFKYQILSVEAKVDKEISIVTTNRLTDAYDFYIEEIKK